MTKKKRLLGIFAAVLTMLALFSLFAFAEDEQTEIPGGTETGATVPEEPRNGIPLIIINIDEEDLNTDSKGNQYGTINDMNSDFSHNVRCKGSVSILTPEGYDGFGESELNTDKNSGQLILSYIRGRGNSTWGFQSKKPYKIKFDKKQNLFGMGKSKEWALIANSIDITLMKNRITSWLGSQMNMPFTPQMIPVDVVMKGSRGSVSYLGSYNLSELVNVEDSRVAVRELNSGTSSGDETDDPNITGGYLLSFYNEGQDDDEPQNSVFRTKDGVEFLVREPSYEGDQEEELTEEMNTQRRYIREYIQTVEDLILQLKTADSDESRNELHNRIADLMDLTSLADYWLIQEFSINGDAFCTSSTYLYKDRNARLCWGPLWDFDLAWGMQSVYPGEEDSESEEDYVYYVEGFNNTDLKWIDDLRANDPQFVQILKDRWALLDKNIGKLTQENGVIDQFYNEIAMSQLDNGTLWAEEENTARTAEDYSFVIRQLKTWIDQRQHWFNENLDNIGKVTIAITYEADGEIIDTEFTRLGRPDFISPEAPQKPGMYFYDWVTKDTQQPISLFRADRDITFVPQYLSESEVVSPKALYLLKEEDWADLSNCLYSYNMDVRYEPDNVTFCDVNWSSSDETIASVDESGFVSLHKVGDVVITAAHQNGVSVSYTLHVYDSESDKPEKVSGIKALQDQITVETGEVKQIKWTMEPENRILPNTFVTFKSDHPEIAEPDTLGVVTGREPGTAVITITVMPVYYDDNDEAIEPFTTTCTVTVVEKKNESSSHGGATAVYYPVNLSGVPDNGSAAVSLPRALKGQPVTVTVTAAEGCRAEGVAVTDRNGKEIAVRDNGDGTYTFVMPSSAVTVTPAFSKIEDPDTPDTTCPKDSTCPVTPFTDTDKNAWYHDGVHWVIENGIMNGTGENTFEPLTSTTRAMIVTMLWRMEGSPQAGGIASFRDVPDGQWYTDAVRWAAANGIVNGYDEDTFGPNDSVTREQLATILYRLAKAKGKGFNDKWSFLLEFVDADQVSDYAYEPFCWMNMNGIIQGMSDTELSPQGEAVRAQAATMLMRFEKLI